VEGNRDNFGQCGLVKFADVRDDVLVKEGGNCEDKAGCKDEAVSNQLFSDVGARISSHKGP
jgi:hypothetical protein